jgi:uncharacterized protein (DUF427 family)
MPLDHFPSPDDELTGYDLFPGYRVDLEPLAGRVVLRAGGQAIADTNQALVVRETVHDPVIYVPKADVFARVLRPARGRTKCVFKGVATYFSLALDGETRDAAGWAYERPIPEAAGLARYMAFYPHLIDGAFDGDGEPLRFDPAPHELVIAEVPHEVRVERHEETLATSRRARVLYETGRPPRVYFPLADLDAGLLQTGWLQEVEGKGAARLLHVVTAEGVVGQGAWTWERPAPALKQLAGYVAFADDDRFRQVIRGVRQPPYPHVGP